MTEIRTVETKWLSITKYFGLCLYVNLERSALDCKRLVKFPAAINMPCGNSITIKDVNDIPDRNVECPCGDPNHYLIYWDIQK